MQSSAPTRYQRLLPTQYAWGLLGLSVLVFTAVIAASNFRAIYDIQKDFIAGSLLSLTGFCFGKAMSRTQEANAIELIRVAPTREIKALLATDRITYLHNAGVFELLALLGRNLDAATARVSDYYDSQARQPEFYRFQPMLRVALDDLDRAGANIEEITATLAPSQPRHTYRLSTGARLSLTSIRRDLREGLGRRDQTYEWLMRQRERTLTDELWDVFDVMTSDMVKADRLLDVVLGERVAFPISELITTTTGYLDAAIRRSTEVKKVLEARQVERPKVFDVMVDDLAKARDDLANVGIDIQPGNA